MPSTKEAGVFAICSTTSAPRPRVISMTWWMRSSEDDCETFSVAFAPHRLAKDNRCSLRSVAMIRPAPIMSALTMCRSPSGPEPITTTVSPELKPSIA